MNLSSPRPLLLTLSFLDPVTFGIHLGPYGAPLVAQIVKNLPAVRRPRFDPWVGKIPCRRERQPHSSILA